MISLRVNGYEYAGWTSARITRGIEAIAGAFELTVTDRWTGQDKPWPIAEEDECTVLLDGVVVITGYVDRRSLSYSATDHTMTVSGRDRTGALVDCSAVLTKAWAFKNTAVKTVVERLAQPFGIGVSLQSGVTLPKPQAKLAVDPGDTPFDVIERACKFAGLVPMSDGQGGLLLTRAGSARANTDLVEGENLLAASADYDASARYARYVVLGQHATSDEFYGDAATTVKAEASDLGVVRTNRVLIVRPEGNVTGEHAKKRAQWEAIVRAARGDAVTVTVQGWTQRDGSLWPVNALARVRSPRIGVDGEMLITQATYTVGDSGTLTQMTLRRPDAFTPEPQVRKAAGTWKEIAGGV